ncbi:hypothetical protein BHM03_00004495 [Ensete ventricosum]|nr:hypothetical protein BHM03_00004495 [Ensete ventricosum]
MLVKSVEKDEKVSPQIMNTEAEIHAIEDSAICGTNDITHTDSGLLTDKLHNSILASNENVEQHEVTSRTPSDEKSEAGLAVSPSDQRFHSAAEAIASQCTAKEGLISSSGDVSKAYLVSSELLEVVRSKEPLDNTSTMRSSLKDCATAVNKDTEISSNFVSHNIQNDLSVLPTVNAGIITEKLDNTLFSEQKMEECYAVDISKRSETLQSENKENETSYNLYGDCKVNDPHFQDQVNNHVCDVKDSSELVSSAESLMLPNDGSNSTVFIQNSGGLLEVFACQVQVSNKDSTTEDKSLTCTMEAPSLAMEKDGIVGRNSVGVDAENTRELSDIAEGLIDFRHDECEYISEEGGVNPQAPATKDSIALEEERDLATSKAVINDNCNELRRSDMPVDVTALKAKIRTAGVDSVKDCKIDTLILKKSDSIPIEKSAEDECLKSIDEKSTSTEESAEDECLKSIAENPTGKLDAPGHAILNEPCAALLDDTENKLSSPVHDKLDISSLVAEHNEANVIHSEEKESTAQLIDSSGTTLKDCSTPTEDTENSSFETQNNGMPMESDKNSIMDQAVADLATVGLTLPSSDNSMLLQQLHSEVEVVVELKEVAPLSIPVSRCDEKNVDTSSLSVTKSSVDNQISKQQFVVPDSEANVPSMKNFSDNLGNLAANMEIFPKKTATRICHFFPIHSPLNSRRIPFINIRKLFRVIDTWFISTEQGISCSPLPGKVLDSPAGWKDSKVPSSAIQSSTVSLQSTFQSSSNDGFHSNITRGIHLESNQSLSPMHPYQTSQIKQYMTNSTPWLSQSPHPASWSFSSQSLPVDSTSQYSAMLVSETAPVTPVRDSSIHCASNMQLASATTLLPNQDAARVSAALVVPFETQNREATPVNTKNTFVSEKSRKRKKDSAPEELVPKFSVSQLQGESASAAFTTNNLPNSAGLSLSYNSLNTVTSTGLVSATTHPITMPYYQILGSGDTQQRVTFSKETCTQIEHSKLQAENAFAYADAAVRHGQVIWEQMVAQRKLGLASEVEQKLASAAAAAAAAASVAKAAAEVAKVASDAALQAKLMADDAINSSNTGSTIKNSEISFDVGKNLLTSTPVSSSKGKDKICGPCSIISEARETTRKRVEAASAAIKRAENLDAILKAAEMAAEAVSQAGTIIAMGDPLPFSISELVEAGPEGHWNIHCAAIKKGIETNGVRAGGNLALDVAVDREVNTRQSIKQPLTCNEGQNVCIVEEMPPNNKKSLLLEENSEGKCSLQFFYKC